MKRKFNMVLASALIAMLCGCTDETVKPLNSPCVGLNGSPCGPKRSVNGKPLEAAQLSIVAAHKA